MRAGAAAAAGLRRRARRGAAGSGSASIVGEVEEMALARVVDEAFAARAEDVAAEQCQGLGQLGVLLLELVVVGRGRVEHALEFVDAALGVFGLLLLGVSACCCASSACCRNSSLRRSRSSSNRWHCSGSSGRRGVTLIT